MIKRISAFLVLVWAGLANAITPVTPQLPDDAGSNVDLQTAFDQAQGKQFRTSRSVPTLDQIGEHEIILVDSATLSLWTRSNGILYSTGFSSNSSRANDIQASVTFVGTGTVTILDSYNVSLVDDNGIGEYAIHFVRPFNTTNYPCVCTATMKDGVGMTICGKHVDGTNTTSVRSFRTQINGGGDTDAAEVSIVCGGTSR